MRAHPDNDRSHAAGRDARVPVASEGRAPSPEPLPALAFETAEAYGMFPSGGVTLAMVSGGADSTALLSLLADRRLTPLDHGLAVLHVNHMLRGEDADADEGFVRVLSEELGVPCRVVRYDVSSYAASERLNLEDAGRRVRYRFAEEELDALCDSQQRPRELGRIAVAHTLDDQVETFLMRLITGTGPGGLRAIAPVRGRIVRPLIGARHEDAVAYLESLGRSWREDVTNTDTARLRARIRHDVVPALEAVNPAFADAVARTVRIVADEDRLMDEMAERATHDVTGPSKPGEVVFDSSLMTALARPMARRVVRRALADAFPETSRISHEHVEAIVDGMTSSAFARDLPGDLRARAEYGRIVVSRPRNEAEPLAPVLLEVPGACDLGAVGRIEVSATDPTDIHARLDSVVVDASRILEPLVVDGPRKGDRMRPFGMKGTKKLSDLFIDAKVPRSDRPRTPVVRHGDRIVWVAGVRVSDDYKVSASTKRALRMTWFRG